VSQENVETVRRGFATWNAGDMDGLRKVYDPNTVVRAPEGWPEPGPFVGIEAVLSQWRQMREAWQADYIEPTTDFIDSADRVLVGFIIHSTGRRGPDTDLKLTGVFTVRGGMIFYAEFFWDHAEALKAVGLEDGPPTAA
jgi:ketosteroid isomerase-like protein